MQASVGSSIHTERKLEYSSFPGLSSRSAQSFKLHIQQSRRVRKFCAPHPPNANLQVGVAAASPENGKLAVTYPDDALLEAFKTHAGRISLKSMVELELCRIMPEYSMSSGLLDE